MGRRRRSDSRSRSAGDDADRIQDLVDERQAARRDRDFDKARSERVKHQTGLRSGRLLYKICSRLSFSRVRGSGKSFVAERLKDFETPTLIRGFGGTGKGMDLGAKNVGTKRACPSQSLWASLPSGRQDEGGAQGLTAMFAYGKLTDLRGRNKLTMMSVL